MTRLLVELRTEELPPKALKKLSTHFASHFAEELNQHQFIDGTLSYQTFATPRRLAVIVDNVRSQQEDSEIIKKGPSVQAGLQDGKPSKALDGFMRANQVQFEQLHITHDGKQDVYAYRFQQTGKPLSELISGFLDKTIKKLPIPKMMHWGSVKHSFVRPVHGLVILHGENIIHGSLFGFQASNTTLGHRFLSQGETNILHADNYEEQLEKEGKVIASFEKRRRIIEEQLNEKANALNSTIASNDALLDEVTALVEWPVVLQAQFESHFLSVPQECLILTMQQNQKYFPLINNEGKLSHYFLLVSNLESTHPKTIIHGNEKVLRARLSDAAFFFQQDKKHSLESRLPKLNNVVYHNKIGSQAERIARIEKIALFIANKIGADLAFTQKSSILAKADLVTDMVGEFPELQGIMGKYYALNDGENPIIAQAIEEHYWPRFAKDRIPSSPEGISVSLADKLEGIVGIWGIGLIPTGDKDPYALRRMALGIINILLRHPLNIRELLEISFTSFNKITLNPNTVTEVFEFIQSRLTVQLQNDFSQDVVKALLIQQPEYFQILIKKLKAIESFKKLDEAEALVSANKRVLNILKKNIQAIQDVSPELLKLNEEKELFDTLNEISGKIKTSLSEENYELALTNLALIKPKIDAFFEHVMVMDPEELIKNNRLNLLHALSHELNAVADISQLSLD